MYEYRVRCRMPVPDRGWGSQLVRVCNECYGLSGPQRSSTSSTSSTLSEAQRHLLESAVEEDAVASTSLAAPGVFGAGDASERVEKRKLEEGLRAFRQRASGVPASDSTAPSVTPRAIGEMAGGVFSVMKSAISYPMGAPHISRTLKYE